MDSYCRKKLLMKFGGIIALVLADLIWGLAFSAQRQGAQFLSANMFLAIRSWIGCVVLIPVIMVLDRMAGMSVSLFGKLSTGAARKRLLVGGFCCGLVIFLASLLQQFGLTYASAGKSGFLTALYIVIVPVLGIFLKKKTSWLLWIAVVVVLAGSYLLCCGNGFGSFGKGDIFLLACAFCYAGHILVVNHFVASVDCVRLSSLQFLCTAILSTLLTFVNGECWDPELIRKAAVALLFCGVGSTGIAFTLQIVGQKYVHPVAACLIMSLESVFSVLGGWLILGEILSGRELTGCALILVAVTLAQIPTGKEKS